jgi:hypothetical protein
MAMSLYEMTVPSYLQTLTAVSHILAKGLAHAEEAGVDPETYVEARLSDDMLPLRFQIQSVHHHSLGAIQGVMAGSFGPPGSGGPTDYAGLEALLAETRAGLQALTPESVTALEGKDVVFAMPGTSVPFTAENFLLSFSFPNFYFHATTAYDILRNRGVKLGKRDFMGPMRIKARA